jgi:isoaspartyl peptidase/L-asparaginase-like protein (Ntn-hydrolase superfamily)
MKKFFLRVSHWDQGLDQAKSDLLGGKHRHDVLEQAIRALEVDPVDDSVGYGGYPNILGKMELDASFMDGNNRNFGAIAGVNSFLPVRIARHLMEKELHTFLISAGAETFARECGLSPEPTLTGKQHQEWERRVKPLLDSRGQKPLLDLVRKLSDPDEKNFDTTIMIASDGVGISGAASTAGWPYKYPGRVGDTPVAGAGLYVDSRYGGCACTYTGEMSTRAGTARLVVEHLKNGQSAEEAVHAAIEDVSSMKGGVLRALVIHAIDRDGGAYAAAINVEKPITYQYWNENLRGSECREVKRIDILHSSQPALV